MARKPLAAVDAETGPIRSRPEYPPRACGYALKYGRTTEYLAFGHLSQNNCTRAQAVSRVRQVVRDYTPVFHNADFDLEVLEADGITVRGEYHDTMRMAFLNEPRSLDLGLKPQAEKFLDMPADELNMLKEWILTHIKPKKKSEWPDYISEAPGKLVGVYAKGDVVRTDRLERFYRPRLQADSMMDAYEREMALIPIKLDMERQGIRVRLPKLKREIPAFRKVKDDVERSIKRRLGIRDINIDSAPQLARALVDNDLLDPIIRTAPSKNFPNGQVSTKRAILEQNCTDKKLVKLLSIYGVLDTYLNTFMQRWIDIGEINDEYVQPTFNTVRSTDEWGGGGGRGTRTGRFSSSDPNFQNVPSSVEESPNRDTLIAVRALLAKYGVNFVGLRDYFAPDEGCVFLRRDYSQQELRILAHHEEGPFLKMYMENPRMDAHDAVRELVLAATGLDFPRKHIKQTNFGIIYGMGLLKLAGRLDLDIEDARVLKRAVYKAVPGIPKLNKHLKSLARKGEPFFTWGGRKYYCEEDVIIDTDDGGKERRKMDYKMMNTLIQGGAADCTKVGMIQAHERMSYGRLVLQVHDELLASVPVGKAQRVMREMREGMEDVQFRVPMLSEGEVGRVSWAQMRTTDSLKKGDVDSVWRMLRRAA